MASTVKNILRIQESVDDSGRVIVGYMTATTTEAGVDKVVIVQYGPESAPTNSSDRQTIILGAADSGAFILP